ncbi:lipoprotein 17-related variable surface protein [Mycoplasma sp. AA7A]|uniref:lipoprotein 17-related variable surface protein n=1 Tax=unclassified Mycoplasma TaxID=2683645 RepID=UPI003AAF72EE
MSKVGKFLLVVVGGLGIGAAAVAIPSVVYKNQRDYQDQQSKLQQAKTNIRVSLVDTINKSEVYASSIKASDIIFTGYNKSLFTVTIETSPASQNEKPMPILTSNDIKGTLTFKYIIRSKNYKDLQAVESKELDGFKVKYVAPTVTPANEQAAQQAVKQSIASAYKTITDNAATYNLSADQVTKISTYSTEVQNGLGTEVTGVLKAVEGVLPESQYTTVTTLYTQVASKLNDVLVNMLKQAIQAKAKTTGIEQIKAYLTPEKMGEIKNNVADVLSTNAETIANVGKSIFESLKMEESTKNIATLDTFVAEMTTFFKTQVTEIAKKVKELSFAQGTSQTAALAQMKDLLPALKTAAAEKAHALLTNPAEYDAVKAILKSKYEALEASVKSNLELLINETKKLAELIDNLKLSQEAPQPEPNPGTAPEVKPTPQPGDSRK